MYISDILLQKNCLRYPSKLFILTLSSNLDIFEIISFGFNNPILILDDNTE